MAVKPVTSMGKTSLSMLLKEECIENAILKADIATNERMKSTWTVVEKSKRLTPTCTYSLLTKNGGLI